MGWFSRLRNPVIRDASLLVWRAFVDDLRLDEAEKDEFESLHECFTRKLKPGVRPIDPDPAIIVSPCDGIVGAFGQIRDQQLFQAKGYPYRLSELVGDEKSAERYRNGLFVTLRLKSSMYHRFHAPCDSRINTLIYISGDTWNVNPTALKRIERLFCKNERAFIELQVCGSEHSLALIAVAAILVASIQFRFLDYPLDLRYAGPNRIECDQALHKGEEIGYFQHGSTILVLAPPGFRFCSEVSEGARIKMGQPLLRQPGSHHSSS